MNLIVSVQKFSLPTTQELSDIAIKNGAAGIRTDKPIDIDGLVIGLKKNDKQYYITTDMNDLVDVSEWADIIAIDSREGNNDIVKLYEYCEKKNKKIVADIGGDKDLINLHKLFQDKKIKFPEYIATTFSNQIDKIPDFALLQKIRFIFPMSKVIAEGGYYGDNLFVAKKYRADYVCIGYGITEVEKQLKEVMEKINA